MGCGIDAIRAFWIPVLNKSKGNAGQAAQSFIKKETVCDSGFDCVSYVHLNVEFASRATLIYNPRGQIVSHAWAAAFSAPGLEMSLSTDRVAKPPATAVFTWVAAVPLAALALLFIFRSRGPELDQ